MNLSELTDEELIKIKEQTENEIANYSILQSVKKVCLNSAYGSLGSEFFRFYDIRNAEAITYTGQALIRKVENELNSALQKIASSNNSMVIAGDTDSVIVSLDPIVKKVFDGKSPSEEEIVNFLCNICDNHIQKIINKIFDDLITTTNAFENHLHMKREKICSSGLWKAKKNYILNVWDNEGVRYAKPKIKISGIQAVKTSTPAVCRGKIRDSIELIMSSTEDEIIKYIANFKKEFFSLSPEEISFPRKVSDVDKWISASTTYIKGTPIQARAAILYNEGLKNKKLLNKYPLIKNGENIKYCYLRLPNPIKEDVIGFVQKFPTEFGLDKYVDYNRQFELTFIQPLTQLLDVIGWRTEKTQTLDDLFS